MVERRVRIRHAETRIRQRKYGYHPNGAQHKSAILPVVFNIREKQEQRSSGQYQLPWAVGIKSQPGHYRRVINIFGVTLAVEQVKIHKSGIKRDENSRFKGGARMQEPSRGERQQQRGKPPAAGVESVTQYQPNGQRRQQGN